MSVGAMVGLCSKHDLKIAGNKVTTEAVCDLGMTKMRSSSVMTLTGNTAYHTEIRASFDPPLKGTPADSLTVIDGKHVGDCKEGQKPGDMTLPNGQQMNIRNWMSGKKGIGTDMPHNLHNSLQSFKLASGAAGRFYSLPALEAAGVGRVSRLPVSIRIVLESVLRNCDGKKVTAEHVKEVANWAPTGDAHRGNPVRRRPRRAAGFHRRAAPGRSRRDAQRRRRHGAEPQGDRAARSRRPRRRPLGDDRLLPPPRRARPQHEARVQAQRRALRIHEVGDAGVRHVQGRAARHRHRPPGEPRIPGPRRPQQGRHLLPRLARRHRQPHDDDQRHRRRRLGRGRHRGRSGDAGPARVLPHARRRRRRVEGPAQRGHHGDRPRADGDRDAAQGKGRRQIRRVLRRRHRLARGPGPRDDRQHGARIRRDDGLLPRRRRDGRLPQGHGAHAKPRSTPSRRTSRRRASTESPAPATSTTRRSSRSTSRPSRRPSPVRSGRRIASSSDGSRNSSRRSSRSRSPRTASRSRPRTSPSV